jgi:hypothetical protein
MEKNLTFTYIGIRFPLTLSSLIETSDGAIAGLGVGTPRGTPMYEGNIFLVKIEPVLPSPSPTELPTPIPTPIVINKTVLPQIIIALVFVIAVFVFVSILLYRRNRKKSKIAQ